MPEDVTVYKRGIRRLTKIEIENYRGVRGRLEIDLPQGENLLIYGENGAGKSSVFHALADFLESPVREHFDREKMRWRKLQPDDFKHRFAKDKPRIALHSDDAAHMWSESDDGPTQREIRDLDKGKGFLDYKALQKIHLLERDAVEIDLFPLVIQHLLPHYPNTASAAKATFSEQWQDFEKRSKKSKRAKPPPAPITQAEVDEFNNGFEPEVKKLNEGATKLLEAFGGDTAITLVYQRASLKPTKKDGTGLALHPPRLLAQPSFRRMTLPDYDRVLNEARLSALAICLFFAALKQSPAPGLRLLALDDILIGLDMANRVKVVDLIREHFKDWQIIILTYSKAWFERLKDHLNTSDWQPAWKSVVLWEEWRDEENSPRIVVGDSGDLIEMAMSHLKRKDYTAAAIYSRKALEFLCHRICAKANLLVLHVESSKGRKVEHYLNALEPRLVEMVDDTRRARALQLIARLKQAREFVLNRNAHFDVDEEDALSGEVGSGIEAVNELAVFLSEQRWENELFQSGRVMIAAEQIKAHLTAARELAAKPAPRQCQGALGSAFSWFWRGYGAKLGIMFPLGAEPTTAKIWKAATDQGKIPGDVAAKLDGHKAYLFGCIKVDKFDPAQFEEAAKLLEELSP